MNLLKIDEDNFQPEYDESTNAIRDFLYMFFEIAGDCRPVGDYVRAELGEVDPYKFLDIQYECRYLFRTDSDTLFLRQGAAINLLCRIAEVQDRDECSGSTLMAWFNHEQARVEKEKLLREHAPDLFRIHEAWSRGRIVATPCIQHAFHLAFNDSEHFWPSLEAVLDDVILKTFDTRWP